MISTVVGMFIFTRFFVYDSLIRLRTYPSGSWMQKRRILAKVRSNQKKLRNRVAHAPENHAHVYWLVEAERHRVLGHNRPAADCYEQAIVLAKKYQFVNDEAMANELAAEFYLLRKKQKHARIYLRVAHSAYLRWGAQSKVRDLEERYPSLLQTPRTSANRLATVTITGRLTR